jgi:hypothetical protein
MDNVFVKLGGWDLTAAPMSMNAAMQQYVRRIQHVSMHLEALFANAIPDTMKILRENVQVEINPYNKK